MESLLIHNRTKMQLSALASDPPHALLLAGSLGLGKRTLAVAWGRLLTDATHISMVQPDEKGSISIEAVRNLYRVTRARHQAHQVVVIVQCHTMGIEAQNAFLKLLEEPRSGVSFVLTTHSPERLLPTIMSRVQTVHVQPLSSAKLKEWVTMMQPDMAEREVQQLLFVAEGRPGVAAKLLADGTFFESHKQVMAKAKVLLTATPYDRLTQVSELSKDRQMVIITLEAMMKIVGLQLKNGANDKWLMAAQALENCLGNIVQNGNLRTQLTQLFVSY